MTRKDAPVTRRTLLQAAGTTAAIGAMGVVAPATADDYGDPEHPSEEWFAREQRNWARTREEPLRQANDPAFQQRWHEQSFVNNAEYRQRGLAESDWERRWNLCQSYAMQCTGDPYLYPESETLPGESPAGGEAPAETGDLEAAFEDPETVAAAMEAAAVDVRPRDLVELDRLSRLERHDEGSLDVTPREAARGGATDVPTASLPEPDGSTASEGPVGPLWDGHPFYDEVGTFERVAFYDSGLDQDEGGARLSGRVWAPLDSEPGDELPGVVITNGSIQASETLYWWFAHVLVEAGYVVMTYDPRGQGRSDNQTPDGTQGGNADSSVFVTNQVDAIDLFHSTPDDPYQHNTDDVARDDHDAVPVTDVNPFWDRLDRDRLGIVGHSLGATGVSVVQGMAWPEMAKGDENPVDVAVAWDNLSEAGSELAGREVVPRVPTMGQSADYFAGVPKTSPPDPDGKLAGFQSWRAAGVPSYQVNVRGGTHFEWSLVPTFPTTSWESWGRELAHHYSLAWLDYWLVEGEDDEDGGPGASTASGQGAGDRSAADSAGRQDSSTDDTSDAERRLLAEHPWHDRLSFYYRSARYFPSSDDRDEWPADSEDPEGWHVCEDVLEGC